MQDIKLTTKICTCFASNFPMAMQIRQYSAKRIAQYGMSRSALDATGHNHWASICTPYCSGGRHGHQFWHKKNNFGVAELLSEASIQKAQNRPTPQLIKATSCIDRSNAKMKAEELSQLSSYQMLTMDKNCWSYQSPKKLVLLSCFNDHNMVI